MRLARYPLRVRRRADRDEEPVGLAERGLGLAGRLVAAEVHQLSTYLVGVRLVGTRLRPLYKREA